MPVHGSICGAKIHHIVVPLTKAPPLKLKMVGVLRYNFPEASFKDENPEVSRARRTGVKDNGAQIFTGTKYFRSWSCLSSELSSNACTHFLNHGYVMLFSWALCVHKLPNVCCFVLFSSFSKWQVVRSLRCYFTMHQKRSINQRYFSSCLKP